MAAASAFGFLKRELQAAGTAFQLLTRIPVPVEIPFTPEMLARSVVYYPVVGAVIGGAVAAAGAGLDGRVPAMPAAVLLVAFWLLLTGGLHLDGLMDTADGVLSHRSRERMLEIMKDSRVGAMGVLAAIVLLLFKFSLLDAWLEQGRNWPAEAALLALACGWSRLWVAVAMAFWPFARADEGMAVLFRGVKARHALAAAAVQAVLTGIAALALPAPEGGWLAAIAVSAALAAAAGSLLAWRLCRKLGGLTGDTYGAMTEILEAILLFALVLQLH
ncbi:adenosylcobinamide-GDP ribazoletransferase [Paenibacillus sp. MWE-103]|uniref:Adenosylcobinamide-GDP ribazoletransferase n=1 Tax=Paenibacillus artemisiicola TaxID=1172618 RepID=A0ABS3WE08_9BACL|nr:adenosylcobinamide-GDP ribazoletransferase [Paenibacillus artemisiicola]MBO7746558.1 adenosylcobinamide-GDP ribazoletransferase [Paenibacillus artemisiicola]